MKIIKKCLFLAGLICILAMAGLLRMPENKSVSAEEIEEVEKIDVTESEEEIRHNYYIRI